MGMPQARCKNIRLCKLQTCPITRLSSAAPIIVAHQSVDAGALTSSSARSTTDPVPRAQRLEGTRNHLPSCRVQICW